MNEPPIEPRNPYSGTSTRGRAGAFRYLVDRRTGADRLESIVDVDPARAWRAISDLLLSGRGVLLAPTSDAGALSVLVYDGQDRLRTYCADRAEFEQALDAISALAEGKLDTASPSPAGRVKPRVART